MTGREQLDPDICERIIHTALAHGDIKGVEAALRVMVSQDPHRAERLMETMRFGLALRRRRDAKDGAR